MVQGWAGMGKLGGGFEDMGEVCQLGKCVSADEDGLIKWLND